MRRYIKLLILVGSVLSCHKKPIESPINTDFTNGILALNEGLFQQNNASLSFYSFEKNEFTNMVFAKTNGRGLGDTANDMIAFTYNGKLYYAIAVNVSSQVEILDGLTLESLAQIGLFNNGIAREPRSLQYDGGYIYSINFDGTVSVISVETLSEIKSISIGQNPESSIIHHHKLYAVNTGGLNYPNYDSTISVIDLATNTTIKTFTAGLNGGNIIVDDEGDGYLLSRGNYGEILPQLLRLNLETYEIIDQYDINLITMTYHDHLIYYYNDQTDAIHRFNTTTEINDSSVFIDCSTFKNVYKIIIEPNQQLIYVIDANGYVNSSIIRIYDIQGKFQKEMISGLNTNTLIFTP